MSVWVQLRFLLQQDVDVGVVMLVELTLRLLCSRRVLRLNRHSPDKLLLVRMQGYTHQGHRRLGVRIHADVAAHPNTDSNSVAHRYR